MTTTTALCSASIVSEGGWHSYPCQNRAKMQHQEKWYCGVHDPAKRELKRKERNAKWQAEWKAKGDRREAARKQRDALAESHAELVAALERAFPVLQDAALAKAELHPSDIAFRGLNDIPDRINHARRALRKARALVPEGE